MTSIVGIVGVVGVAGAHGTRGSAAAPGAGGCGGTGLGGAAAMTGEGLSAFLVKAADQRADEVFASEATTFLPAVYFDDLLAALDEADPAPRLEAAVARARRQA